MQVSGLWPLIETYHAVVYFAPERQRHYAALGLKGGWMGYFATRSGALGAVPPSVVTACFYNFKHTMVARALPDAWLYTTPEEACAARLRVVDDAMVRILGASVDSAHLRQAAELAVRAVEDCDVAGRPLFAAHAALEVPEVPHLALFWATTALREYRGDGHSVALAEAEIDGCEAHVLLAALGLVPADQRRFRGWDDDDWAAAVDRLRARGWLDEHERITAEGRHARLAVEDTTDRLASPPLRSLGPDRVQLLESLLTPIAAQIMSSGELPYPNPMGMARFADHRVSPAG